MANKKESISRYDCVQRVNEEIERVFSPVGERPKWNHSPSTHSPRLTTDDISVLEKNILECLRKCKETIEKDKDIPLIVNSPNKESCPCCTDNGADGAENWSSGYCQKCREAGCPSAKECIRPPEHTSFYTPGVDAPHGWGNY